MAAASTVVVIVVALAGLYFGRYWVSDAIGGAALAYIWVAIVALTAMCAASGSAAGSRSFMPVVVLAVVVLSVAVQLGVSIARRRRPIARRAAARAADAVAVDAVAWKRLPCYRSDMGGDHKRAAHAAVGRRVRDSIRDNCARRAGSRAPTCPRTACSRSLRPTSRRCRCRCLPKLNNGVPSSLVFMRPGDTPRRARRAALLAERLCGGERRVGHAVVGRRVSRTNGCRGHRGRINILRVDRARRSFDAHPKSDGGLGASARPK